MIDFGYGASLREIDRSDTHDIRYWRNDPKIYKWCRQNSLISDIQQERWFEAQSKDHTMKMYGIVESGKRDPNYDSAEGPLCGVCGLTSIDLYSRRAEFSIYTAPNSQKRGIGKAALQTLVSHGFFDLGLNSIWGETFESNPASAMFEKVGFKKEGTRREFYFKGGKFIDAHLYSILASEWVKPC